MESCVTEKIPLLLSFTLSASDSDASKTQVVPFVGQLATTFLKHAFCTMAVYYQLWRLCCGKNGYNLPDNFFYVAFQFRNFDLMQGKTISSNYPPAFLEGRLGRCA